MASRLTKRSIEALQPRNGEYEVRDPTLPGFGVRVWPSGRKVFVIVYRPGEGGRTVPLRRLTLGTYGTLTVDQARKEAQAQLGMVRKGKDPATERQRRRSQALLVSDLCDQYLAADWSPKGPKKPSTKATDTSRISAHIRPLLGTKRVGDITRADIEQFMRDVAGGKTRANRKNRKPRSRTIVRGGEGTATRTVGLLGSIFAYAVMKGYRDDNPVRGVKRYTDAKRKIYLKPDQLIALGKVLALSAKEERPQALAAIRLLLLTGCRRGEVLGLRWEHVDFENAALHLPDSKTGQKSVPLGAAALELLASQPRKSDWVFPSVAGDGPLVGLPKIWGRIRSRAKLDAVRLHDLRHTFASVGVSGGASLPVIGAILGHRDTKTTARYAHLRDDPVRAIADRVAGEIAARLAGDAKTADVVPIRQAN